MLVGMTLGMTACTTGPRLTPLASDKAPSIGSGRYRFQLQLIDADGKQQPNIDFALSLEHGRLPFISDEKNVWRARTDEYGRTPIFALPFRPREKDVLLRERVGDGPFGEQFWLADDKGRGIAGLAYRLLICTDPPREFIGRTDARGYTVYAASQMAVPVGVYADQNVLVEQGRDHHEANLAYCRGEAKEATVQEKGPAIREKGGER